MKTSTILFAGLLMGAPLAYAQKPCSARIEIKPQDLVRMLKLTPDQQVKVKEAMSHYLNYVESPETTNRGPSAKHEQAMEAQGAMIRTVVNLLTDVQRKQLGEMKGSHLKTVQCTSEDPVARFVLQIVTEDDDSSIVPEDNRSRTDHH